MIVSFRDRETECIWSGEDRKMSRSSTTTHKDPKIPLVPNPHPGEILLEDLIKPIGLSQNALARALKVPPRRVNELVHGKRAVSADTDLRLVRYFGLHEGFFPGLQAQYDRMEQRRKLGDRLKEITPRAAERHSLARVVHMAYFNGHVNYSWSQNMLEAVFGSAAAEKVLLYLQCYENAYGREIATNFGLAQSQAQKQLLKLESGGMLVSHLVGRTRVYGWNPRNPLVTPLRQLLQSALDSLPATEQQRYFRGRRRPRRSGKAL